MGNKLFFFLLKIILVMEEAQRIKEDCNKRNAIVI